jgi:hypothetical protein
VATVPALRWGVPSCFCNRTGCAVSFTLSFVLTHDVCRPDDFRCGPFCGSRRGPSPTCSVQCAGATCNPIQGNIDGKLLFLDVSGDVYPRDGDSAAVTPAGCCSACGKTDGCNAWVVCNNPQGCGQGCQAFARQLGPFHSCSDTDSWPYQMCSLKRVSSTSTPPTFPGGIAWPRRTGFATLSIGIPFCCDLLHGLHLFTWPATGL